MFTKYYDALITGKEKPSILIIDDDPDNLTIMTAFLEEQNYTILVAEDGEIGLQRAQYALPDLIILDIMMPNINGYDACRRLKQMDTTRDIPVIFVTALQAPSQLAQGLAVGAVDFITKPFIREELIARVNLHIRLAQTTKQLQANNRHLETVFASIQDGMFIIGKDGKILSHNNAARMICGIIPSSSLPSFCSHMCRKTIDECFAKGEGVKMNRHECSNLDGIRQIVSITASPLKSETGECYAAVVLIHDETLLVSLRNAVTVKGGGSKFIGKHPKIKEVHNLIADCSKVNTTVLILGESGTGKELVADLVQENSTRKFAPYVKVNCAGMSDSLIESELFGHVKGAYTDAHADRVGRFELANGGTIFLDEIGDISPRLQLRLLRVLENRNYERVGDSETRDIDVRVIAATNSNLEKKVSAGEFRKDLYYRLKIFTIKLPPLRERKKDIPVLVAYFFEMLRPLLNKDITEVSKELLDFFTAYPWDGNVRELRNTLEYAMVRTQGSIVQLDCLPGDMVKKCMERNNPVEVITLALLGSGGNKSRAARALGIDRKTLYRKIEEYGIVV